MKITDEQIEKAADAAFHAYCNRGDASAYTWWRDVARAALEAVMPEEPVVCRETPDMHHNEACGTQDNLKPCPFCGVEAEIEGLYDSYVARCSNTACPVNVETCFCESEDEAAAIWNRRPAPEPGELEPDYCFDPNEWDSTHNWDTRDQVHCWGDAIPAVGDMMEVHTLIEGPAYWVARVPVSYTEDGDVDETTYEWFRSEAEARAALAEGGRDE